MRVVTWNINSLRARVPRLHELFEQHRPDVVLLQETKCSPEVFPHEAFTEAGYRVVDNSGGQWAGVAIAVREGLEIEDPTTELFGNPVPDEARWIEATVDGIRFVSVYVVNGRALDHEMYFVKLAFLEAMAARAGDLSAQGIPTVIAGDMNVCPADIDVWSPAGWEGMTHVSPAERKGLAAVREQGHMVDAHVHRYGDQAQEFTWWDYRGGSFHKNQGLRIDLHLVSADLADQIADVRILRELRKGEKPSDHVPLELELTR